MKLPKNTPTEFCRAFIARELESYKEDKIWMSCWSTMERLIDRSNELELVFEEIVKCFGYSDKHENSKLWLVLEHVWHSAEYSKDEIIQARINQKEISALNSEVVKLSEELAASLKKLDHLYKISGFIKPRHQTVVDIIEQGAKGNYHYETHVSEKIRSLECEYDYKYWPEISDVISSIALFESSLPLPEHLDIPSNVLNGRVSDIKDFVLAFDNAFYDSYDIPDTFRFSNNALSSIINVVLDLPVEKIVTGDSVRLVRNRY